MDESAELTDDQLRELSALLRDMAKQLQRSLEDSAGEAGPVNLDEPIGRLSRMDAIAQREINQAGRRQQQQTLTRVRAALAALERGEYGLCRQCEEPIAYRRLRARPDSSICLRCQAAREAGD